ncbi:hypothetical protein KIN20_011962 [Parelaphostrongylus tenuis]|uniref:Uncharacterized protein n=1 Tax=Parelaphostrongylus tenuis TaxID=148309 RepID=A0AAD5QMI7_PARTN|nr:hypothetical protein KIN20_011962 [Parelaphostrongylus tenuis]
MEWLCGRHHVMASEQLTGTGQQAAAHVTLVKMYLPMTSCQRGPLAVGSIREVLSSSSMKEEDKIDARDVVGCYNSIGGAKMTLVCTTFYGEATSDIIFPPSYVMDGCTTEMKSNGEYRLMWELVLIVFILLYSQGLALKCYVGSKGLSKNGNAVRSFVPNECDDGMTHCFESYTDDMSQITASCQSMNTEKQLLDVCKEGCRNHTDLHVTICCCDSDLCNLPPEEKENAGQIETMETSSVSVTTESMESSTVSVTSELATKEDENLIANLTELNTTTISTSLPENHKFMRLPHVH